MNRVAGLLVCLGALAPLGVSADPVVPVEPDAPNLIKTPVFEDLLNQAVAIIRERGWRCDSFSSMTDPADRGRFTVTCNHHRYTYVFEDRGGEWAVRLQ